MTLIIIRGTWSFYLGFGWFLVLGFRAGMESGLGLAAVSQRQTRLLGTR